jgi:hypothetical protein
MLNTVLRLPEAAIMHAISRCLLFSACLASTALALGCKDGLDTNIARFFEANRLAADLQIHFTKASQASDRAVMADTEAAMLQAADEVKQEMNAVDSDVQRLTQTLQGLHASDELELVAGFRDALTKYQALDREILELTAASTNLKAQRLSFGPAKEAADAFRDALAPIAHAATAGEGWHARALANEAVLSVREVQVLQAPHIAEAQDAAMDELEKRMTASMQAARDALTGLSSLNRADLRPAVDAANAALARFTELNAQIVVLSRRNSNVRSLALTLGQKRVLAAACEARLRALAQRLAQRRFTATR